MTRVGLDPAWYQGCFRTIPEIWPISRAFKKDWQLFRGERQYPERNMRLASVCFIQEKGKQSAVTGAKGQIKHYFGNGETMIGKWRWVSFLKQQSKKICAVSIST